MTQHDETEAQDRPQVAPAPADTPCTTVYYDGSCALCSAEIRHYAAQPGADRLAFVDVSRADSALGPDLTSDAAMGRLHVRGPRGELVSGAEAFVSIWGQLRGWRLAARFARLPGVTPVLEALYRLFLPIRPTLSKAVRRLGAKSDNLGEHPTDTPQ